MTRSPFDPASDEPAVLSPALRDLVARARPEAPRTIGVDYAAVRAALDRRASRRRRIFVSVAAAAAAAVVAVWGIEARSPDRRSTLAADAVAVADGPVVETGAPSPGRGELEPSVAPAAKPIPADLAPTLAEDIELEPISVDARHQVLAVRVLRVEVGGYRVSLPAQAEPVTLLLNGRTLELTAGVVVAGLDDVRLERGVAHWIGADGTRTPVPLQGDGGSGGESTARKPSARASAQALAREAERSLEEGDRAGAIEALEQIVVRHPRSSAARTALMDLGRLYRAAGQTSRARCAYSLYLERWPGTQLRDDLERAASALGEGPTDCSGLGR